MKTIEDALGHEDYQKFLDKVESLHFNVKENTPLEIVNFNLTDVCFWKKKISEAMK